MTLVGTTLMGWCGVLLAHSLGPGTGNSLIVAEFAIGVIFTAQAPYDRLERRLRQLE